MNLESIEAVFFNVLEDINEYLQDLTLVGGWMPYIYSSYLWKNYIKNPVTTVDIDFGVDQSITRKYPKTIYETLSSMDYKERYPQMDRLFPVVLYKEKIPIEFITYPNVDINAIQEFVGRQILINKIDKFDFLLNNRIPINLKFKNKSYFLNCPKPSAFLYHKGATFTDRENEEKLAKDLYYMYFILRYVPDYDVIMEEISQYKKAGYLKSVSDNLNEYFERISSQGCLLVEQENGIDEYIQDLRQDIFERFDKMRKMVSR
jgi:hypothetical protein